MNDSNFKNNLQSRLNEHSTPLDLEQEWNALEERRRPKKKRRLLWLWLFTFGALALSVISWQLLLKNEPTANIAPQSHIPQAESTEPRTSNPALEIQRAETATQSSADLAFPKEENEATKRKSVTTPTTTASTLKTPTASPDFSVEPPPINETINTPKQTLPFTRTNAASVLNNAQTDAAQEQASESMNSTFAPVALVAVPLNVLPVPEMLGDLDLQEVPYAPVVPRSADNRKWTLGIAANYQTNSRTATGSNRVRNQIEDPLDSWQANVFARRQFKKGWIIQAGLEYRSYTDRFDFEFISTDSSQITDQVVRLNYLQNGRVIEERGSVMANWTTYESGSFYQRYQLFSVSILAGKRVEIGDQGGLQILAGPSVPFLFKQQGRVIGDNQEAAPLSSLDFKTGGPIALQGALVYLHPIGSNLELFGGLSGSAQLANVYQNNLQEKRRHFGGQLGLTWRL